MKTGVKTGNPQQHLLVVGGYGVVGTGVVNHILGMPDWRITTVGRSPAPTHLVDGRVAPPHIQADLLDTESPNADLTKLSDVTAMVFCAYVERESMAATVGPNVDMLANALDRLRQEIRSSLVYERLMAGDVRRRVSADRVDRLAPVRRP
jgi:nucleoside-diphosphate-sugar epimerase